MWGAVGPMEWHSPAFPIFLAGEGGANKWWVAVLGNLSPRISSSCSVRAEDHMLLCIRKWIAKSVFAVFTVNFRFATIFFT